MPNNDPDANRSTRPLRVCIDARLSGSGAAGGVEQFVIGLARGLSQLSDETTEYSFLTYANEDQWLRDYIGGPCRIIHGLGATRSQGWSRALRNAPRMRAAAYKFLDPIRRLTRTSPAPAPPKSDGLVEHEGFDLVHFPTQNAFITGVPSIYHPWDLQHLHLPQYFTPEAILKRETEYRTFCSQAVMVVAATSWQRQDLIAHYELPEEKVQVIAPAPVVEFYPVPSQQDLENARRKFALPPRFLFYPAQTWPHKNHVGLLRALARIRDSDGVIIPLVSTGKRNEYFRTIENTMAQLNLMDQVFFLDYVSPLEMQCLYRLCRAVVFPTLFEGFGMPVLEAFSVGAPTACSNTPSLTELATGAALIFDPLDTDDIGNAVLRLWSDDALCQDLAARGQKRVRAFSWDRTARVFRAHYRRLSGTPLTSDDDLLLRPNLNQCTTT